MEGGGEKEFSSSLSSVAMQDGFLSHMLKRMSLDGNPGCEDLDTRTATMLEADANETPLPAAGSELPRVEAIPPGTRRSMLLEVVKSLGLCEPSFIDINYTGLVQVHVDFRNRKADRATMRMDNIAGEICTDHEQATKTAAMKAFEELENSRGLVVEDLSTHKISCMRETVEQYSRAMHTCKSVIEFMLREWEVSVASICNVCDLGGNQDPNLSMFKKTFLGALQEYQHDLHASAIDYIRSCCDRISHLDMKKSEYKQASPGTPYPEVKFQLRSGFIPEMYILLVVLQWLDFKQADYVTKVGPDGLYLGGLILSLPDGQDITNGNGTFIAASRPEKCIKMANNSAAREAILYLEKLYNFEVVDYNFSDKVKVEAALEMMVKLENEYLFTSASLLTLWENIMQNTEAYLCRYRKRAMSNPVEGLEDQVMFQFKYIADLQDAQDQCIAVYKNAASKFSEITKY